MQVDIGAENMAADKAFPGADCPLAVRNLVNWAQSLIFQVRIRVMEFMPPDRGPCRPQDAGLAGRDLPVSKGL